MAVDDISPEELGKNLRFDECTILFYIHIHTIGAENPTRNPSNNGIPVREGCGGLWGPSFYDPLYRLQKKTINGKHLLNFANLVETLYSINIPFRAAVDELYRRSIGV